MSMTIEVEFLTGTDIREAVSQAKAKASQWDVSYVSFDFNDVPFLIGRGADVDSVVNEYVARNKSKPPRVIRAA